MARTKATNGVENGLKKGLWTEEEDKVLVGYVEAHGKGKWNAIAKRTGLRRCGRSCRLRWMNYLSPDVKRDGFSEWSLIAKRVPGRTDNQVKNYWNTHLSKKLGFKVRGARYCTSATPKSFQHQSTSTYPCSTSSRNTASNRGPKKKSDKDASSDRTAGDASEPNLGDQYTNHHWDLESELREIGMTGFM